MKRFGLVIKQNIVWLGLLLLTDVAFCFFMWLVAPEAFVRIRVLVGMFTVILFAAVCSVLCIKDRKKIEAYCAKYGDSDSANVPDVVFWAGVYKAICEIKNAPEEKVQIARTWLKAHGFSASIS